VTNGESKVETLKVKLLERVEHHQKMERLARVWKQGTISYHKAKSEAFQEALAIIETKEGE
jgi:hypothetical protein